MKLWLNHTHRVRGFSLLGWLCQPGRTPPDGSAGFQPAVSRISNPGVLTRVGTPCRLEAGDSAGWKPARQRPAPHLRGRQFEGFALRNDRGSALLVVFVLLAVITVIVVSNGVTLRQLKVELDLTERRQLRKFSPASPAGTNSPAAPRPAVAFPKNSGN